MNRRSYLGAMGGASLAGVAGCLDDVAGIVGSTGDENAVLGPPEQERGDPSHPIYGDEFPHLSLRDPLLDEEVSTADFEGERSFLITFVYTNCHDDSCPMLLSRLVHAQEHAAEHGYADDVALLAMTFDPDRDTSDVLRAEGETQGVDFDAGNWHFLRPESFEDAEAIVEDDFGLALDNESLHDHDHGDEGDDDHDEGDDGEDHDHDGEDQYDISHYNLIFLVNEDGYVERSYPHGSSVEWSVIVDDLETVVEG